jgi:hypothetical protein
VFYQDATTAAIGIQTPAPGAAKFTTMSECLIACDYDNAVSSAMCLVTPPQQLLAAPVERPRPSSSVVTLKLHNGAHMCCKSCRATTRDPVLSCCLLCSVLALSQTQKLTSWRAPQPASLSRVTPALEFSSAV